MSDPVYPNNPTNPSLPKAAVPALMVYEGTSNTYTPVSAANPLPVTSSGGGGGGLSDTILTDDSGVNFIARDNGTTITYVTLAGAPYTPSTNIKPQSVALGATSTLQTAGNASLTTIAAGVKLQDGLGNAINSLFNATGDRELLTATGATNFTVSTNNSTVAQLAASAIFTGVIENAFNAPSVSVLLNCDQPGILTFNQYITSGAGTECNSVSYVTPATTGGNCFTQSWVVNGNDVNFTFQNTGGSTTTTLNLNVAYGNILPATSLLNLPIALREVNGKAFNLGQQSAANSLSVISAANNGALTSLFGTLTPATNNAALASAGTRKYLIIQNSTASTGILCINFGAAAGALGSVGQIELTPGSTYEMNGSGYVDNESVNLYSAVAAVWTIKYA